MKNTKIQIINDMADRKLLLFPDIRSTIVEYDCIVSDNGLNFNVATAPLDNI